MTDWKLLAQARHLDIPDSFLERVTLALASLEADFQPLLKRLEFEGEPAVTLSEAAVLGGPGNPESGK